MSRINKRKLEDFDPNKSDSDDEDYDNKGSAPPRSRTKKVSRGLAKAQKQPRKRQRGEYADSEDDIVDDEDDLSLEEDSFDDDSDELAENAPVNPTTGRRQRAAARQQVNYGEESEDEIQATSDDDDSDHRTCSKKSQSSKHPRIKDSLIVKLSIPKMRETRSAKATVKSETSPDVRSGGARRSSRISRASEEPLVQLTDSGKHTMVARPGSRQTSEEPAARRSTRGGKSVKGYPSAIMEASEGESAKVVDVAQGEGASFLDQLQEHASGQDIEMNAAAQDEVEVPDDVIPSSEAEEDVEAVASKEDAAQADDDDDDDGPVRRSSRTQRQRAHEQFQDLQTTRRSLRQRKATGEPSSDFEPEAEEEPEENLSDEDDDDAIRPAKRKAKSSDSDSGGGRRSGRLANKRQKSQAPSESEHDLDVDEIADEAAALEEDRRRNRPRRRGRRGVEISYEPALRTRSNRPDYRLWRPEVAAQMEEEENGEAPPTASQTRSGRRAAGPYRSLFSTYGPFGGAGGPQPVFGGAGGAPAAGGADSDSSDDDTMRRPSMALGGTVGMTPTQGQAPFGLMPQPHNADPAQGAGSGAPANFGKVKDKKALADADPLGVDPNVSFDAVGGLGDHIDRLKEMVALPLLYPEIFMRMHVTPPRGVLFHGPPGTGKTLLARALASSVSSHGKKVTFYMRKGADALSKWVGEAERQLRMLFEEARKNQPSIIFFDEIDGLAPVRSSKQEQIHASIVATLLALMDGMDGRGQVIVIGATNRPDSVDPALRRPGRFDREFYFPLPNKDARRAIIDIHTKGWDPPLKEPFKDQLSELTKGYGGADLRALCTEAALNAVQGTFPQIYTSNKKLLIDPTQIKVLAKDFMISVNKIVPSSERSATSGSAPLKKSIEPLLRSHLAAIQQMLTDLVPNTKKRTALEEAEYDDRDDELGFEKENLQREFEGNRIFRPRLLITGVVGMGQQYLGAALLNKFEGMYVANFDLPNIFKDSTRSPEAAIVQMFEEVKRHKPSVVYIPNVDVWYTSLQDHVIRTFTGLLRSLPPTDPVLLLGIMESDNAGRPDNSMMRDLFSYSRKNLYVLHRPDQAARQEYFSALIEYIRRSPSEFPDPENRKKRELPVLPEAPSAIETPKPPTKEELKAQKKQDRQVLNTLKLHIQPIMDQIKLKYRKFRAPPIDERALAYLFDEQDPGLLTTDLAEEEAQQLTYRPYKIDEDGKGVRGLREIATGKFFYNLEIVTIEQRLSNGYYKRFKDFLADIKRLAKDSRVMDDPDRIIKANELYTNVEVDIGGLEKNFPALVAESEAVYQREKAREAEQKKALEGQRALISKVPAANTDSTDPSTGPIRLGVEVPALKSIPPQPFTPAKSDLSNGYGHSNGSDHPYSNGSGAIRASEDAEMANSQDTSGEVPQSQGHPQYSTPGQNTQTQKSQHSSIMQMAPGSQPRDYVNSASTTTSGQKTGEKSTSDRSNRSSGHTGNIQSSNGLTNGGAPDWDRVGPAGGSQLPDTQEQFSGSQITPHSSPDVFHTSSQQMPPPERPPLSGTQEKSKSSNDSSHHRATDIDSIINHPSTSHNAAGPVAPQTTTTSLAISQTTSAPRLIPADSTVLSKLASQLVFRSSGLSVEQLEQMNAALMRAIWNTKREWNRNRVVEKVGQAFNDTLEDIEAVQVILKPSQEDEDYGAIGAGREVMALGSLGFGGSSRGTTQGTVLMGP